MNNKKPNLILIIDSEADTRNSIDFTDHRYNDLKLMKWFLPKELHYLISKKVSKKKREEALGAFTEKYYSENKIEIKEEVTKVWKNWKEVEDEFYNLVDRIFKSHLWPKGKYKGIASIYNMYPRWIDRKIFFFPYLHNKPKFSNDVIAHEMLHFIYFDYIKKKYNLKEDSIISGKEKNHVWKVSEVFNNVIENWEPYSKIFKNQNRPYVGKEIYPKMKRRWSNKQDIDWLLDKWLK